MSLSGFSFLSVVLHNEVNKTSAQCKLDLHNSNIHSDRIINF